MFKFYKEIGINLWRMKICVKFLFFVCVITTALLFKKFHQTMNTNNLDNGKKSPDALQARDMFIHNYLEKLNQHNNVLRNQDNDFKLNSAFKQADKNEDEFLQISELIPYVSKKIKGHLSQALKENIFYFTSVDNKPKNGEITWEEYLEHFLKQEGLSSSFIAENLSTLKGLTKDMKEAVMRKKAAWVEAALEDSSKLSITEFLGFRHPEASNNNIVARAEREIQRLDLDGDDALTEEEFVAGHLKFVPNNMVSEEEKADRIYDFQNLIDKSGNGRAERAELIDFYNPSSVQFAEKEVRSLLKIADTDSDRRLSFAEVLTKKEAMVRSKFVDVEVSLHEEF